MSSLRMRVLEYIAREGGNLPYQEVAAGMKENPQRVRGALNDASNEGYLKFDRDDVTGQGGYSLTGKGVARIKNGHQTINGKTAKENKEASDAREAVAHVMSVPAIDTPVDEALPDPVLLAEANRMLSEKVENLESDIRKQRTLIASKNEYIVLLETDAEKLTKENTILRQEAAGELTKKPIGYACMFDFDNEPMTIYDTEQEARNSAIFNVTESPVKCVHVVAILDTAELSVKWERS